MRPLILALVAWMIPVTAAWSCSCFEVTPEENYCQVDLVFTGEVLGVAVEDGRQVVQVLVLQTWKGMPGASIAVKTELTEDICGIEGWTVGQQWLFYVYDFGANGYFTWLCDRTQQLPMHSEDAAFLASPICTVSAGPGFETSAWGRLKATYR